MVVRGVLASLLASLVLGPFLMTARQARACSCAQPDLRTRVVRADLIILGTVLQIVEGDSEPNRSPLPYDLTVEVDEYLKGEGSGTVTVRDVSSLQSNACSAFAPDAVGRPHLLILFRDREGYLGALSCAGSGAITDRNREHMESTVEQIRQIVAGKLAPAETVDPAEVIVSPTVAPGELPTSGARADRSEQRDALLLTGAAAVALLGLTGLAVVLWRRTT